MKASQKGKKLKTKKSGRGTRKRRVSKKRRVIKKKIVLNKSNKRKRRRNKSKNKRIRLVITKKQKKRLNKKIRRAKNKLFSAIRLKKGKDFLLQKNELLNVSRPDMKNHKIGEQAGGGLFSKLGLGDVPIHLNKIGGMFNNAYRTYMGDKPLVDPHPLTQNLKTKPILPDNIDVGALYKQNMA